MDARRVEHHARDEHDGWRVNLVTDGVVSLAGLAFALPLDELFAGL